MSEPATEPTTPTEPATEPPEPETPAEPTEPPEPETPAEPTEPPEPETPAEPTEPTAESEPPDDTDDDEDEEALRARAEAEAEAREQEKQMKALDRAQTTYERKVVEILKLDGPPPACEACNGTGMDFTGRGAQPEFEPSKTMESCPDCGGLGKVSTGSKVFDQEVLACMTCQGNGWVHKDVVSMEQRRSQGQGDTWEPWMGDRRGVGAVT